MEAPTIGGMRVRKGNGEVVRLARGASLTRVRVANCRLTGAVLTGNSPGSKGIEIKILGSIS